MTFVSDLEPKSLWKHFDMILTIPRGSKNEEKMREYVISVAEKNGLSYKTDAVGNVVVKKPATPGHEKAQITILQSHLDMVNEKNSDVEHDFDKDPIKPRREGDYLMATGTTLGADNGIGVAAMLALMEDKDIEHGPLEFLFTIDEETGLTGASNLGEGMLEGKRLINLDTEEENCVYVGCAGGGDTALTVGLSRIAAPRGTTALQIKLAGLKGGHSGCDIHLQRGNATKLLTRALFAAFDSTPFHLALLEGGNKHNAIPREAHALVIVAEDKEKAFLDTLEAEMQAIAEEFKPAEPDMRYETEKTAVPDEVWDEKTTMRVMSFILALPHGVMAMSYDIPNLVETSTNLAAVKVQNGSLQVLMSSRSSVASALKALRERIRAIGKLVAAEVEEGDGYPGWKPNLDSPLLAEMTKIYENVVGVKPEVLAVHAGLECGIIGEKYPGMDMVSIGPRIEFPHSPDERVKISTVKEFYDLLVTTLKDLS